MADEDVVDLAVVVVEEVEVESLHLDVDMLLSSCQ